MFSFCIFRGKYLLFFSAFAFFFGSQHYPFIPIPFSIIQHELLLLCFAVVRLREIFLNFPRFCVLIRIVFMFRYSYVALTMCEKCHKYWKFMFSEIFNDICWHISTNAFGNFVSFTLRCTEQNVGFPWAPSIGHLVALLLLLFRYVSQKFQHIY